MQVLLKKEWQLPESAAQECCDHFLRQFRNCPDHTDFDLDDWRSFLWASALDLDYQHLAERVFPIWKKLRYTYLTLEEDVIQLLSALRKHYTVGLITNGPSRSQWEKIAQIHAEQFFDLIIVSGDLSGCEKPQAEIFHLACQQLNVKPNKSCMIGDRLDTDILGGQNAGLATVWIPLNGECAHMPTSHNPPDFTIDCLMDLAPMFGITADEMRSSI